jgi:hypothetical protein
MIFDNCRTFLCFLLILTFISCTSTDIKKIVVDPKKAVSIDCKKNLSDYSAVQLETTEASRMANPVKLIITGSSFVIFDNTLNQLFFFDAKSGRFLNKVKPADSSTIVDLCYDSTTNQVQLLSVNEKLALYNLREDGGNLNLHVLPDTILNLAGPGIYSYSDYWVFDRNSLNYDGNNIAFFEKKSFKFIKSAISIAAMFKGGYIPVSRLLNAYHDTLFYLPLLKDTIYAINRSLKAEPAYNITIVKGGVPKKVVDNYHHDGTQKSPILLLKEKRYIWQFDNFLQTDNFLYFSVGVNNISTGLFYDKSSHKSYLVNSSIPDSVNNRNFAFPAAVYKNLFVSLFYSRELSGTLNIGTGGPPKLEKNPTVLFYNINFN